TGIPAVEFGPDAATLIVEPGAYFNGQVAADAGAGDVLDLAGTSAGTLTGFGSQVLNFASINFGAGARWFIAGSASGFSGAINGFTGGDTIELTGVTATNSSYAGGV